MLTLVQLFIESRRSAGLSHKTLYFYQQKLESFQRFVLVDGFKTMEVNSDLIGRFLNSLNGLMSEETRKGYWRAIRAFVRWGIEWDYLHDKTLKRFHPRFGVVASREPLYDDDLDAFFMAIPTHTSRGRRDRALFSLLLCCGLRVSEAVNISLEHVDIVHHTVKVKGKGDKWRTVPIPPKAIGVLTHYMGALPGPWLFPRMTHGRIEDGHLRRESAGRLFRQYCKLAGLPPHKYCAHCLRHTYASKLFNGNVDLAYISKLMGHSSVAITHDVYAHVFMRDAADAVNRVFG